MLTRTFFAMSRPVSSRLSSNYNIQRALLSSDTFKAAVDASKKLSAEPSNDVKLQLYSLYKQVTVGKCNTKRPGMLDMVGKAKWDAWSGLGDMTKEDAERTYIAIVNELNGGSVGGGGPSDEPSGKDAPGEDNVVDGLNITLADNVLTFRLNAPRRKNPISIEIYETITNKLREAADDPNCRVAVITGTGDYYSSGNDLKNFQKMMTQIPEDQSDNPLAAAAERGRVINNNFQKALVDFPKPLIALVNGPAIGIMVTSLALFDAVLASETATFSTPFTQLAQTPEGCSSLTFPLIMGPVVASDVLLFGRVLTAKEAADYGLVSRVFPASLFAEKSAEFVKYVASLPPNSVRASKQLIRGNSGQPMSQSKLREVSDAETNLLSKMWLTDECVNAITSFLTRKKSSL